ncbi:Uncharacterized protein dnm_040865 [Desulfonema magnum]|uniref:Uncharacterized protein n=1 Tax=Desulfonema magnum TaxID=45655 RepID=A0A975GNJ7_9BACT|nr:Uncharacterized protein dnm_040865 [Desulfonema magnum]
MITDDLTLYLEFSCLRSLFSVIHTDSIGRGKFSGFGPCLHCQTGIRKPARFPKPRRSAELYLKIYVQVLTILSDRIF